MTATRLWRTTTLAALATVLACSAGGAAAQSMKPGLWEVTTKMTSSSGDLEKSMAQMQKQMAAMTPEQRKMMEEMMGKQGGGMAGAAPGGTPGGAAGSSVKICVTQEMADKQAVPKQQGDCTHTNAPRSGNTMKFSFVCTKPPSSGEGQVTFNGPDNYSSNMTVTATHKDKTDTMHMDGTGKFLSSDCGTVKPLQGARQK